MDKKCECDHVDTTLSESPIKTGYIGKTIHIPEAKELRLYDVYKKLLELEERVRNLEEAESER